MAVDMKKMKDAIADIAERNLVMEKLLQEMARRQRILPASDPDEPRSFI